MIEWWWWWWWVDSFLTLIKERHSLSSMIESRHRNRTRSPWTIWLRCGSWATATACSASCHGSKREAIVTVIGTLLYILAAPFSTAQQVNARHRACLAALARQARVAQSKHSVLPVPVGLSSNAFSFCKTR